MSSHQGPGQEGEDVDEVGVEWEGAGGQGEGADPGRARGVRLLLQPGARLSLCRIVRFRLPVIKEISITTLKF